MKHMTSNTTCHYCIECYYCANCDYCADCHYCDTCTFCTCCDDCHYCDYCHSCTTCDYCYFCKNLRFTEYNIFCSVETYNGDNSSNQKPYRAFNKVVGKERYEEIVTEVEAIIPNPYKIQLSEFWNSITTDQWTRLSNIPEFDIEVVEFITGIKIDLN